jgi:hypothetical protein
MQASGLVEESNRWPEGLTVAGVLRPEPSQQTATDEDAQRSWGHVLAASLANHGGLREDLIQGLCLFRLAGYRSYDGREPDETRGSEILALLQSKVAQTAAAVNFAFPLNTSSMGTEGAYANLMLKRVITSGCEGGPISY